MKWAGIFAVLLALVNIKAYLRPADERIESITSNYFQRLANAPGVQIGAAIEEPAEAQKQPETSARASRRKKE